MNSLLMHKKVVFLLRFDGMHYICFLINDNWVKLQITFTLM